MHFFFFCKVFFLKKKTNGVMSRKVDRYIGPILHFLIYRHRPISVFSSADLKSDMFAGSPVLKCAVERAAAPCEGPQAKSFGRFHNSPGRYS